MNDESPFRSPQILETVEPLDDRSERILQWRKAHRRLELGFPGFVLGSVMLLGSFEQNVAFIRGDFAQWPAFLGSWFFPSIVLTVIILFALLPRFTVKEFLGPLALAWLPFVSIVGLIAAMRKVQVPLRAEGLEFGWVGPPEKLIIEQLRHQDGSPVDPKSLGIKR